MHLVFIWCQKRLNLMHWLKLCGNFTLTKRIDPHWLIQNNCNQKINQIEVLIFLIISSVHSEKEICGLKTCAHYRLSKCGISQLNPPGPEEEEEEGEGWLHWPKSIDPSPPPRVPQRDSDGKAGEGLIWQLGLCLWFLEKPAALLSGWRLQLHSAHLYQN